MSDTPNDSLAGKDHEDLQFSRVIVEPSGEPVEFLTPSGNFRNLGIIPSPLCLLLVLQKTNWVLNPKWQTSSHVYRVLNDLHHRQRFSELRLVYLPKLQLVLVTGLESRTGHTFPREPRWKKQRVLDFSDTGASEPSAFSHQPDSSVGVTETATPAEEAICTETEEEENDAIVFLLPGNSRTGCLSGRMRRELVDQLSIVSTAFVSMGHRTRSGWIIAITDLEDVSYYVEKNVVLSELMEAGGANGTRDGLFSRIFGSSRAINLRSVARKEERKEYKRIKEKRLQEKEDAEKVQSEMLLLEPSSEDDGSESEGPGVTKQQLGDSTADQATVCNNDKYSEVLHLIDKHS